MILNFIFSHLNAIALFIWIVFAVIVGIRYFKPSWLKYISYNKLIVITIILNILYMLFVTWGLYHVWSTGSEISKFLLKSPLSQNVPLPSFLEWTRSMFNHDYGYFLFYVLGRFWFYALISFVISGLLYILFKIWESKRGGFDVDGPKLMLVLMLLVGWPGILVFIPVGFIFAVLLLIFNFIRGRKTVEIEPSFIAASFITLLFSKIILNFF